MMKLSGILLGLLFLFSACSVKPRPIVEGSDACEFCKMTVMEKQFAAELVTDKGKYYVFDDIRCLQRYLKENPAVKEEVKFIFVTDFNQPDQLFNAENAFYFTSDTLHTPMGGNTVALSSKGSLEEFKNKFEGEEKTWDALFK